MQTCTEKWRFIGAHWLSRLSETAFKRTCALATGCRQLLGVQCALLNDFCDAFVTGGNPQHDGSRFTGFHFVGNRAHFLGAETPKFWIVQFARGHRSTVTAWSPPYLPCALGKVMLSINFDIAPKAKWASTNVPANVRLTPESGHLQCTNECPLWVISGQIGPLRLATIYRFFDRQKPGVGTSSWNSLRNNLSAFLPARLASVTVLK